MSKKTILSEIGEFMGFLSLSLTLSLSIAFWKSSTKLVKLKASGKKRTSPPG